jgi:translation initiation factor 3 subunit M
MPSSSKLVNTSEAFELRLVHFLGNHEATSPFIQKCEALVLEGNASSLIHAIFDHAPALDVLFNNAAGVSGAGKASFANAAGATGGANSEDGIHAFSLLCALIDAIEDEKEVGEVVKFIVGGVEAYKSNDENNSDVAERKLKMLCALYNLRHAGQEKCWLLSRILHTCAYSGDDECVLSLLPGRDSTLGTLLDKNNLGNLLAGLEKEGDAGLSATDKRVLYSTASSVTAKVEEVCKEKGMDKEASTANGSKQQFLLKMLSTYATVKDVDEEALVAAKQAAIGAICDPISLFNEQRCIMSLPPVLALEKNKETKPLFDLLSIFQQGKLEDFQSFQKTNSATLEKHSISLPNATRNMRLLSLCSLATEHEEIPYDAIASTLQIESSDVESWVIDAVSSGLLSAKMDQLEKVVLVERCVVRMFGIEQWKILQKRIDVWKKNVKDVLDGLKSSQIGASAM